MKKTLILLAVSVIATAVPLLGAPEVTIINPPDGGECPSGKPLEVGFVAKGGPFNVFRLTSDTAGFLAEAPGTDQPEAKGVLIWKDPQPGKHEITVSVYDVNKEEVVARVRVIVTAPEPEQRTPTGVQPAQDEKNAAERANMEMEARGLLPETEMVVETKSPEAPAASNMPSVNLKILSPADGAYVDAVPSTKGFYECSVEFEASGSIFARFGLEADGILMSYVNTPQEPGHVRLQLPWWPMRGNGRYELTVYADPVKEDYGRRTAATVTVNVRGIPPDIATPQNRIIGYYREKWGLDVPSVPIGRFYDISKTVSHHWISTAYLPDTLYVVMLSDNAGDLSGWKYPLGRAPAPGTDEGWPVARPSGTYDIMIAFIDFGDTGITRDDALGTIPELNRTVNAWHERFAREHGLKEPIMKFRIAGAYAKAKPNKELLYSVRDIKEMTGIDPADYHILAQVDLFKRNRSVEIHGKDGGGGMGFWGAKGTKPPDNVNIWCVIDGKAVLDNLAGTLLDHELSHILGWQHEWPVGNGGHAANFDRTTSFPTLMFGWTDLDGDGVPEIIDPTPYGWRPLEK